MADEQKGQELPHNQSPKEQFLASKDRELFERMAMTREFNTAIHFALLQLLSEMPPTVAPGRPSDPFVGADANSQMFGAKRFAEILRNLSIEDQPQKPSKERTIYRNLI